MIDLFLPPPPITSKAKRVSPLGEWPALAPDIEKKLRALERWRRYAQNHKAERIQAMRDYRARRAA